MGNILKIKSILYWGLVLPGLSSCAIQPEKRESWVDLPASRAQGSQKPAYVEPPWVGTQRMVENHEAKERPVLVDPYVLQTWLGSTKLQIWDLNPETVSKSYPAIKSARVLPDSDVTKMLGGFAGSVVLVSHQRGQDRLNEIWKKLSEIKTVDVLVLDGGIEAWAKALEKPYWRWKLCSLRPF